MFELFKSQWYKNNIQSSRRIVLLEFHLNWASNSCIHACLCMYASALWSLFRHRSLALVSRPILCPATLTKSACCEPTTEPLGGPQLVQVPRARSALALTSVGEKYSKAFAVDSAVLCAPSATLAVTLVGGLSRGPIWYSVIIRTIGGFASHFFSLSQMFSWKTTDYETSHLIISLILIRIHH